MSSIGHPGVRFVLSALPLPASSLRILGLPSRMIAAGSVLTYKRTLNMDMKLGTGSDSGEAHGLPASFLTRHSS